MRTVRAEGKAGEGIQRAHKLNDPGGEAQQHRGTRDEGRGRKRIGGIGG